MEAHMTTDGTEEVVRRIQDDLPASAWLEAAEAHFAVSDDSAAWLLYMISYNATPRDPGALGLAVLMLARSAQDQQETTQTGQILDGISQTAYLKKDDLTATKCRLLKAHMQARNRDNVNEVFDTLDIDLQRLAQNVEGLDILTAHLLQVLSQAKIAGPSLPSTNHGYSVLWSCIMWFSEQLDDLSITSIQITMLDGIEDAEVATWREETELFFTLWRRWKQSHGTQPEWVTEAEAKLGITAAELLATVSCMVLDAYDGVVHCDEDEDDSEEVEDTGEGGSHDIDGDQSESDVQGTNTAETQRYQLLDIAREGVSVVVEDWCQETTWTAFLETFDRRNTCLSDPGDRPDWMSDALGHIAEVVTTTLLTREGTLIRREDDEDDVDN